MGRPQVQRGQEWSASELALYSAYLQMGLQPAARAPVPPSRVLPKAEWQMDQLPAGQA
jgi:hypothetical protein